MDVRKHFISHHYSCNCPGNYLNFVLFLFPAKVVNDLDPEDKDEEAEAVEIQQTWAQQKK